MIWKKFDGELEGQKEPKMSQKYKIIKKKKVRNFPIANVKLILTSE